MGFLADVGRANVLGQTIQYGQFTQQAEESKLKQQLMQSKLAEEERLNRPMLLSELVGKGSEQKPNTMKIFQDAVKMAGLPKTMGPNGKEDYIVTQKDLPNVQKFIALQNDLHVPLLWAERSDNQLEIDNLMKQMGKGKPMEELARHDQIEQLKKRNADILLEIRKGQEPKQEKQEDQYSEPYSVNVGGKEVLVKKNLRTNEVKQVSAGPTGTTVNVNNNPLKPMSAEAAGRFAMLRQGADHVRFAENILFPNGKFSRMAATGSKYNLPGGEFQKAHSAIQNAINSKLRAETGAAATEEEMANMLSRFEPDPVRDNAESARKKLDDLWDFLNEAAFYLDPEGEYDKKFKEYRRSLSNQKEVPTVVERRKTSSGKILEKLSDGTIREAQ